MRLVPLGVRGSTAAPGAAFVRYGGHTSCIAVYADADEAPRLVLDAGTGLSALPDLLSGAAFQGRIILTHLHWDHVQGLPFSRAVDRPDAQVDLHIPATPTDGDEDVYALLARAMSPPHFPIAPDGLQGDWRFAALRPGRLDEEVQVQPVAHKGGLTFGVRVEIDGHSVGYLPDHALCASDPGAAAQKSVRDFVEGVDILVHDGQFTAAETTIAVAYGHATIESALEFADDCSVGAVVLTHHAPTRTDNELDALAARFGHTPAGRAVSFARQGIAIDLASA